MFPARRHPLLASLFHLALLAVVVGAMLADLPAIVSQNSEAFSAVFLVSAALQYLRVDRRNTLGLIWVSLMVAGLVLTDSFSDKLALPNSVATHQEAFAAAAILTAYLMYPHGWVDQGRHRHFWPLYLAVGTAYGVGILGLGGETITDHAETIALVLLIGCYFDFIVDRSRRRRILWAGFMAATPLVYTALNRHGTDALEATNQWEVALVWVQRTTEAFVAVLLLQLYLEAASLWPWFRRGQNQVGSHSSSS